MDHIVILFKAYMDSQIRRCTCSHSQPRPISSWDSSPGRRSRTNSLSGTPQGGPPRLKTSENVARQFPVSGHGVHPRRASEKEGSRNPSSSLSVPFPPTETCVFEIDKSAPVSSAAPSSFWRNLCLRKELESSCERGGWGIIDDTKIMGIRRRSRTANPSKSLSSAQALPASDHCLSPAILERWEVWLYDPTTVSLQQATLSNISLLYPSLAASSPPSSRRTSFSSTRGNDSIIPRLPFTRVSPVVDGRRIFIGFGNTIGILESTVS